MLCRITDMHSKEVINVCDGTRLGCVDDVEVDTCTCPTGWPSSSTAGLNAWG